MADWNWTQAVVSWFPIKDRLLSRVALQGPHQFPSGELESKRRSFGMLKSFIRSSSLLTEQHDSSSESCCSSGSEIPRNDRFWYVEKFHVFVLSLWNCPLFVPWLGAVLVLDLGLSSLHLHPSGGHRSQCSQKQTPSMLSRLFGDMQPA